MQLLPNQRLITSQGGTIYLYDYSGAPEILSIPIDPPSRPTIKPVWKLNVCFHAKLSLPLLLPGAARIIVLRGTSLFDITIDDHSIPQDTFNEPVVRVIRLSEIYYFKRGHNARSLGYNRGVLIRMLSKSAAELNLLEYRCGKDIMDPVIPQLRTVEICDSLVYRPLFDEGSGRVVVFSQDRISVVDLALVR